MKDKDGVQWGRGRGDVKGREREEEDVKCNKRRTGGGKEK